MLETTISNFLEEQFPVIYREEGPFFVEFLKQYYVWMETDETSPLYQARHHLSNHDIDSTVDNFVIYFKEKYLKNIQINTATNTKQLIKNSIDLYRSKGTENAIKLFFDLIFSSESEVYYPGTDVFRLSNSEWIIPQYLEVNNRPINRLLVGQVIRGTKSGSTAFVEKLVRRRIKNNYVEVFYISAVTGSFKTGERIVLAVDNDSIEFKDYPKLIGSLTELKVMDGGDNFSKGEIVKLTSRTGDQGRALVSDLQSITGIVEFDLLDGGWGYSVDTDVYVSETVLNLSNVNITSTTNNSLYGMITTVSQPMANVQWYNNTGSFVANDVVSNYYANGSLIGTNRILSAEYGTSNTTNFFLLNLISGNNYMDPLAPTYYSTGNASSFTVQNAGWTDVSANSDVVGMSSNVTIYCTGNSQNFTVDDHVYQKNGNNVIFADAKIRKILSGSSSSFSLEVDSLQGLFLTNNPLVSKSSSKTASIKSLSYDIGVRSITHNFSTVPGNKIYNYANTSAWNGTVSTTTFGTGANTSFDPDLLYPETVDINTNYLRDHIDETDSANWVNAVSYGASLHTANLTNMTLASALMFDTKTLGSISRLQNQNPGIGYSYAPFVKVIDPLVAPLNKMDFIIRYSSTTGVFSIGEEITQSINGALGVVKFANTSEAHIKRLTFEDRWTAGNSSNTYLIVGSSSGFQAYPTEVTSDIEGVAGLNANVSTKVTSSDTAVSTLKITDSGFCFRDSDKVSFTSLDDSHSGVALASVRTSGIGSGYYRTTSSFLSTNKYLHDGDYYQNFSYEIRSPVTINRYADMLRNVLHVSGTKAFSSILKNEIIDSSISIVTSTVSQSNTV